MQTVEAHLEFMERMRKRFGIWVDIFRVRESINLFLSWIPVHAHSNGISIRIRCWSDILAFSEIFRAGVYDAAFDEYAETYCDLGCQSGMALLRLACTSKPPRHSLLIDANPRAVERCRANLHAAHLTGFEVIHGAAGSIVPPSRTVQFTLRPNELECSLAKDKPAGRCTVIDVPVISLEETWLDRVGDIPCDLLKMDIEGAEFSLLQYENLFLERVRRLVLEWHDPPGNRDEALRLVRNRGFSEIDVLYDGPTSGLLYCRRSAT